MSNNFQDNDILYRDGANSGVQSRDLTVTERRHLCRQKMLLNFIR